VRLTTSPPSCAECHEIWEPKPPGTLWATPGLLRDSFTFTFTNIVLGNANHLVVMHTEFILSATGNGNVTRDTSMQRTCQKFCKIAYLLLLTI
jgi:hypothetical protein